VTTRRHHQLRCGGHGKLLGSADRTGPQPADQVCGPSGATTTPFATVWFNVIAPMRPWRSTSDSDLKLLLTTCAASFL